MKMQNKVKEKLVEFARRAMKQADAMNKVVEATFNGGKTLVYPHDDTNKVMGYMKLHALEAAIAGA